MGLVSELVAGGAQGVGQGAAAIVHEIAAAAGTFITTDKDRDDFRLKVAALIDARDARADAQAAAQLEAQRAVIVAELQQGDAYTKRARPTVIYAGLAVIAWNYSLVPVLAWLAGAAAPVLSLPDLFWQVWGGVAGLYTLARTSEKAGTFADALGNLIGKRTP